ncbi:MAG: dihydroneopterin aldolase [Gemmatimonadetes bacterium]|nr:dihydroneopterin aldolase [Gemmatimonadota bacterium]
MPGDWINVRGIRTFGHHGVTARERARGQVFEAHVALRLDLSQASRTDRLSDTVDYADVCLRVGRILGGKPCSLLEAVAGRVADELLSAYPPVDQVVVRLWKPGVAADLPHSGSPGVTVHRNREAGRTGP